MIAQTAVDFLAQEVWPHLDRIDQQEEGLMPKLLEKAGELGLLGISVPEDYGGFGKDFVTGMLVTEKTGAGHSYSVAMAAHTGIGTLPILYYGNAEQKAKYIPQAGERRMEGVLFPDRARQWQRREQRRGRGGAHARRQALRDRRPEDVDHTDGGFADVFTVFCREDR